MTIKATQVFKGYYCYDCGWLNWAGTKPKHEHALEEIGTMEEAVYDCE